MSPALFYKIDCSTLYYDYDFGLFIAHPELIGIKTKNLPNKIIGINDNGNKDIYSIDYTFTNDGYIESCTIQDDYYYNNNLSSSETTIVTFTWE